jgi:hypothetical protein
MIGRMLWRIGWVALLVLSAALVYAALVIGGR